MDGEKAAEAFFRCIVSMSNLEAAILLCGQLSPVGSVLAALDSWNDALKDWPRLTLTEQNPLCYTAENSFFYLSNPPPFVQGSAAFCLWLAAHIS